MKKKALYPGTFDPLTLGHVDIVMRALNIFDEVVLAVAASEDKSPMFSLYERVIMVQDTFQNNERVKVEPFKGLMVDCASKMGISVVIRGLRAVSDFEYELQLGYANQSLNGSIETIYLMPSLEYAFISSSVVRSILKHGGDASKLLPKSIADFIKGKDFVRSI